MSTKTRFKKEAKGNSEMAYSKRLPFKKRGLSHDVQLLAELAAHVKHEAIHTPHSILPLTLK